MFFNELLIAFVRRDEHGDAHFVYLKQDSDTGEYGVFFRKNNEQRNLYSKTPFIVQAMNTLTMLMCESGIGSQWRKV